MILPHAHTLAHPPSTTPASVRVHKTLLTFVFLEKRSGALGSTGFDASSAFEMHYTVSSLRKGSPIPRDDANGYKKKVDKTNCPCPFSSALLSVLPLGLTRESRTPRNQVVGVSGRNGSIFCSRLSKNGSFVCPDSCSVSNPAAATSGGGGASDNAGGAAGSSENLQGPPKRRTKTARRPTAMPGKRSVANAVGGLVYADGGSPVTPLNTSGRGPLPPPLAAADSNARSSPSNRGGSGLGPRRSCFGGLQPVVPPVPLGGDRGGCAVPANTDSSGRSLFWRGKRRYEKHAGWDGVYPSDEYALYLRSGGGGRGEYPDTGLDESATRFSPENFRSCVRGLDG